MSCSSRMNLAIRLPVAPVPRTSTETPQRIPGEDALRLGDLLVEDVEARDLDDPRAQDLQRRDRLGEQLLPATTFWRRAASSEAVRRAFGLVDSTRVTERSTMPSVDQVGAEVEDRRLGHAAAELVDRVEHDVGAAGQGVRRQFVGEGQVRPPRLVDDERHARGRARPRPARRCRRRRRSRWGRSRRRRRRRADRRCAAARASGVRQWATPSSSSISGATNVGFRPLSTRPSITDEWTLRCTIADLPRWARAMQIAWLPPEAPLTRNQLRFAPQASAASRCACWNGVSSGSGPMSTSSMPAGKSSFRAFSPSASTRPWSAPAPPLWPGMWKRPISRDASSTSASRYGVWL